MAEAERTGIAYKSRLDPPPANGWCPSALPLIEEDMRPDAKAAPLVKESAKTCLHPEPDDPELVPPPEDLRLL